MLTCQGPRDSHRSLVVNPPCSADPQSRLYAEAFAGAFVAPPHATDVTSKKQAPALDKCGSRRRVTAQQGTAETALSAVRSPVSQRSEAPAFVRPRVTVTARRARSKRAPTSRVIDPVRRGGNAAPPEEAAGGFHSAAEKCGRMLGSRREDVTAAHVGAPAAAGSALRPIRRLVEAAVAHSTGTEVQPEVESQEGEGPSQIHHPCFSHVFHLLFSPRT